MGREGPRPRFARHAGTLEAGAGEHRPRVWPAEQAQPRILGRVVPYDKVWRTGANAATALSFDREFTIGGKTIPPGSYTVWTLPKRDGVDLIINRQVGRMGDGVRSFPVTWCVFR